VAGRRVGDGVLIFDGRARALATQPREPAGRGQERPARVGERRGELIDDEGDDDGGARRGGGRHEEEGECYAEASGLHVLQVPVASMRRQQRSQKRAGPAFAGRATFFLGAAARGFFGIDAVGGKLSSVARCCSE